MPDRSADPAVRVDPVACDGIGICAHLAPELIRLDSWGYPIVDPSPVPLRLRTKVKRAIAACPRRALFLE